jgi:hypothetical protein
MLHDLVVSRARLRVTMGLPEVSVEGELKAEIARLRVE